MDRRGFLRGVAASAATVAVSAGAGSSAGAETPQARGRPNIVVVLADDLGYGDLSCYGQAKFATPNLDRMAAEGVRLTDFYSGSTVCAPSRCVLLTGRHTGHCYVRGNGRENLRPGDVTLPEVLKRAGYDTRAVGKWGLGPVGSAGFPLKKGFNHFYGFLNHGHAHNYYPAFLWRDETKIPLKNVVPDAVPTGAGTATERAEYAPDLFAAEVAAYLDSRQGQSAPFFLYYCPTLPHANNEAQRSAGRGMECPDDEFYRAVAAKSWPEPEKRKAAMIARLDAQVGQLLDRLKANGLDDNTLVFFSSDNGPHAEGGNDPAFFRSGGPFRGIKRDLYEGGIRVPTLVRWPGRVPAGSPSSAVGYFADVLPTLAGVAGVGQLPDGLDGVSLVPVLNGKATTTPERALYWEFYERGGARAVRMGKWKGVCQPWNGPLEVYDLEADPGETCNRVATEPEVAGRLRAALSTAHVPSPDWKLPSELPRPNPAGGQRP